MIGDKRYTEALEDTQLLQLMKLDRINRITGLEEFCSEGRRQKEEVRNSAAGGTKHFLLNLSFLLSILSAAQNAAGRSEMGQPTV